MTRTKVWLESHILELPMQKTEVLLLTRRHISADGISNALGVRLDTRLFFFSNNEGRQNKSSAEQIDGEHRASTLDQKGSVDGYSSVLYG